MIKKGLNTFNSNSCAICKYSITDPICKSCYIKETLVLLNDLGVDSMISDYIKVKLKNVTYSEAINDTECILCKKGVVYICRYCFSILLLRVLRELNFTEDLINNFKYNSVYGEVSLATESIFKIEKMHKIEVIHDSFDIGSYNYEEDEDNSPIAPIREHLKNYS